jgi:hypothetical protein
MIPQPAYPRKFNRIGDAGRGSGLSHEEILGAVVGEALHGAEGGERRRTDCQDEYGPADAGCIDSIQGDRETPGWMGVPEIRPVPALIERPKGRRLKAA